MEDESNNSSESESGEEYQPSPEKCRPSKKTKNRSISSERLVRSSTPPDFPLEAQHTSK